MNGLSERYDVVVVGAGPAGSVAARYAADLGVSVLMLERDREPGIPVRCAEGVPSDAIREFIPLDERWICTRIFGARLVAPNGTSAVVNVKKPGMILERRLFDRALADLACAHGVHLFTRANVIGLDYEDQHIAGVRFRHLGQEYHVRCAVVIGADGVESMVGRWAGIDTHLPLRDIDTCVQYTLSGIEVVPDTCEFHFGHDIAPGGYLWVFPKSAQVANVGIGMVGTCARPKAPREFLDDFVARRFPGASVTYWVCGGVPTGLSGQIAADHVLLTGDAARQVNPLHGGGIVNAMIAGSMAGKTAAEAVAAGDCSIRFLSHYEKAWQKAAGNHLKSMYAMKDRFLRASDSRIDEIIASCGKIAPGKLNVVTFFAQILKDNPRMVAEIARHFLLTRLKWNR